MIGGLLLALMGAIVVIGSIVICIGPSLLLFGLIKNH
jgi:hypothetical protein